MHCNLCIRCLLSESKKRLLICFDEFQMAKDLDGADLIAEMRTAFQRHDMITYVFMGSETGILNELFGSPREKFFNSAVKFHLGPIAREAFTRFIQEKFAMRDISVSVDVCGAIYRWGAGISAHIQHLCSAIWDFMPEGKGAVSAGSIEEVVRNDTDANDGLYLQMWQTIGDAKDQMLLQRLSRAKGLAVSSAEFCGPLSMNPATVTRRLAKIASKTRGVLIHQRASGYAFSDPFFEEWVRRKT